MIYRAMLAIHCLFISQAVFAQSTDLLLFPAVWVTSYRVEETDRTEMRERIVHGYDRARTERVKVSMRRRSPDLNLDVSTYVLGIRVDETTWRYHTLSEMEYKRIVSDIEQTSPSYNASRDWLMNNCEAKIYYDLGSPSRVGSTNTCSEN